MNDWMSGSVIEWVDESSGWVIEWVDEWFNEWMDRWIRQWSSGCVVDTRVTDWMDECVIWWVCECLNAWMNPWMSGRVIAAVWEWLQLWSETRRSDGRSGWVTERLSDCRSDRLFVEVNKRLSKWLSDYEVCDKPWLKLCRKLIKFVPNAQLGAIGVLKDWQRDPIYIP